MYGMTFLYYNLEKRVHDFNIYIYIYNFIVAETLYNYRINNIN